MRKYRAARRNPFGAALFYDAEGKRDFAGPFV